jgi:hypothetical protein
MDHNIKRVNIIKGEDQANVKMIELCELFNMEEATKTHMEDFNTAIGCIENSWKKDDIMTHMNKCIVTFENKRKKDWEDILELLELFELE